MCANVLEAHISSAHVRQPERTVNDQRKQIRQPALSLFPFLQSVAYLAVDFRSRMDAGQWRARSHTCSAQRGPAKLEFPSRHVQIY